MPGIIGRKIGMTSVYDEGGKSIAATVIEAGPCVVTQVKSLEVDGYRALQMAYGEKKEKNTTDPMLGHFKKAGTTPKRHVVEFRDFDEKHAAELKLGSEVRVSDIFKEGDWLDVIGISKGRGFQGVVKRHGFAGVGSQTHGQHNRMRAPGSVGNSSFASRVPKGRRMAGRMGGARVKTLNLQILKLLPEHNLIVVNGPIPGHKQSIVILEK